MPKKKVEEPKPKKDKVVEPVVEPVAEPVVEEPKYETVKNSPRIAALRKEYEETLAELEAKIEIALKSVDVYYIKGGLVRTYSEYQHGKDYKKIAEQFVAKKLDKYEIR